MCGRFTLNIPPEVLVKVFDLQEIPQLDSRYNIAPSQTVASVRHIENHNKLDFLKWGLVPPWSKDLTHSPINVRSESVTEKPTFRHAIKYNRCIIPASGYYEWKTASDAHRQPYYIRHKSGSVLGFAGLWERWIAPDGNEVETCCILTTAANKITKTIHDRMPVILQPDNYNLWLNRNMHDPHELQFLYEPYPPDQMVAYPVPALVNNPKFDSPSCIVQV